MRVLIVDDDPGLRLALSKALSRKGVDVVQLGAGEAALEPLSTGLAASGPIDVCLLDLKMPGLGGLDVLRRTAHRCVPIVVLTGHGSVPDAVEAMRLGATNFMQKPVDADQILPVLQQAVKDSEPIAANTLLGASDVMLAFIDKLDRIALGEEPLLISGETGTGKELCARRIHGKSSKRRGPFVVFNATTTPQEWIEAELCGTATREGLFSRAADGTLYVDEIADLSLDNQARLMRVLETKKVRDKPLKARFIAATQRDLRAQVEQRSFRDDLYYLLNAFPLAVPPLRDRGDDVVLLARACLGRASNEIALTPAAEDRLRTYAFPGNVRELANVMKRAALFGGTDRVDVDLIDELLRESPFASSSTLVADGPRAGARVTLEELEKTHIMRLLSELKNVSEVARIVGIDRRTLQRKMSAWGLRDAERS